MLLIKGGLVINQSVVCWGTHYIVRTHLVVVLSGLAE